MLPLTTEPRIHARAALRRCALRLATGALIAPLVSVTALAAVPPLALPSPQASPAPEVTPLDLPPATTATPNPAPAEQQLSPAASAPRPAASQPSATSALGPIAVPTPDPVAAPPEIEATGRADNTAALPRLSEDPASAATAGSPATDPVSSALGASVMSAWWPLFAGALVTLGVLLGVLLGMRRRQPKVLQLAAPAKDAAARPGNTAEAAPARLDCQFDILSAARSVMMFSIEYRLEIANRSGRAARDLTISTRLGYPGRTGEDRPLAASAEDNQALERIGPNQSRTISGTLRLPLSEIAPMRQGDAPLLIPLFHVIIEGAGRPGEKRVFVAGTPSSANLGRLQPIRLDGPPGGIAGLKTLPVNAP